MTPLLKLSTLLTLILPVTAIKNPILPGWNPDPSILRLNNEYYLTTSSFEYFPGLPIYKSTDLANWTLHSYALTRPSQLALYGTPTGGGTWAPTLSHINNTFYIASMTRWTYDPVAKVWPRITWISSPDLETWSDPIWAEPWGIDPSLFQDPVSGDVYLNLMAPDSKETGIWGIYQCQVDLRTGECIDEYRSLWNGTMSHTASARPEGPKMFMRGSWYYLLIAEGIVFFPSAVYLSTLFIEFGLEEGGTDDLHRASIARSRSPGGPWIPNPANPLLFNGAYGFDNLTVQSTGHATIFDTAGGDSYAVYIARRKVNGSSPLGRETFLSPVTWKDGWPVINDGRPVLLSESFGDVPDQRSPETWVDRFEGSALGNGWYQLRTPYTENVVLREKGRGVVFRPNVYSLSERDVPAAILRKQTSLNMTVSAELLPIMSDLRPGETVGISVYLSEFQHQDLGVRGCAHGTGMCVYTQLLKNGTVEYKEVELDASRMDCVVLHIRAEPLCYHFGLSVGDSRVRWLASIESKWLAFAPPGWFVFEGASFALFASGNGRPWSVGAPEVGFRSVTERYFEEIIPDYDRWE
ncbi:beta-xylosidase [Aspergillus bombycis]|uniref:Beta-xylosidase n=1 Tax=Aspergillus bombycis TaxID=109264 RepID=A0A1F7ZNA4_9EURO|nr:beta-xylosidase [Aspergillus bombycis]OGM40923.1 beta-xylosidase [Aspergillus bombycis]